MENSMQPNDEELEQMTQEEIKDAILEINKEQLYDIRHIAILEIFQMMLKLKNEVISRSESINQLGKEGKRIQELLERVEDRVDHIDILLTSQYIDSNLKIDYFRRLREEAYDLIKSITGYLTEISYSNEITNNLLMQQRYKDAGYYQGKQVNWEKAYKDLYNFIIQDEETIYEKISKLISILPMRTTKRKLYDILRGALTRELRIYSKDKVTLRIDRYKSILNGALDVAYGNKFDKYFTYTQRVRRIDFKEASMEELEEINKETTEKLMEIYTIIEHIRLSGMIINRFMVICMINDRIHYHELDTSIETIKDQWKEIAIQSKTKESETFYTLLDSFMEKAQERMGLSNEAFETLSIAYYDKGKNVSQDLNDTLLKTQNILALLNDIYLEKEVLLKINQQEAVDPDYLEQVIDNFIQYIDRNIRGMDNIQRKTRLRRLLSTIKQPFHHVEAFFNYLKNSIETNTIREDKLRILDQISSIMEDYQ